MCNGDNNHSIATVVAVPVTGSPTAAPTQAPTQAPTAAPTHVPTHVPTPRPSGQPTPAPTPQTYAKCNTTSAQCEQCDHVKDPTCLYTTAYCQAAEKQICKKPSAIEGVWRGIQIQKGFCREEWDFKFGADGSVTIQTLSKNDPAHPAGPQIGRASCRERV